MKSVRNNLTGRGLPAATWAVLSLVGSLVLAGEAPESQPVVGAAAPAAPAVYPLRIEGRGIERLELADEDQKPTEFTKPGTSVLLPAGRYFVREVELTGGFECYGWLDDGGWITLPADSPPVVKAGAPLTPKVHLKRAGRLLQLDYQLVDAAGRGYSPDEDSVPPPKFVIHKNGQIIGSGSFEYG